jgi:hypothetical protein
MRAVSKRCIIRQDIGLIAEFKTTDDCIGAQVHDEQPVIALAGDEWVLSRC